jgi:hypothetical protein
MTEDFDYQALDFALSEEEFLKEIKSGAVIPLKDPVMINLIKCVDHEIEQLSMRHNFGAYFATLNRKLLVAYLKYGKYKYFHYHFEDLEDKRRAKAEIVATKKREREELKRNKNPAETRGRKKLLTK